MQTTASPTLHAPCTTENPCVSCQQKANRLKRAAERLKAFNERKS